MFGDEKRVDGPRLKGGAATDWQTAIEAAAAGLKRAGGARSRRSSATPPTRRRCLVQGLLREALGSPHVDSRPSRGPGREAIVRLAQPDLSARVRDIDDADVILVLGTDPLHSSPILDLRVRKAIRRNGARLAIATERPTALDGGAEAIARYAPGEATHFVSELTAALGGADTVATPLAETLRDAGKVVVVWGERIAREGDAAAAALLDLAAALERRQHRRRRPARSPRHRQRPRPARGRLPPRRRPRPRRDHPRQVHRGDPRGPGVRRAQVPGPLRRRPPPRLPRHQGLGGRDHGSRLRRQLLDVRDRHHRQGRRRSSRSRPTPRKTAPSPTPTAACSASVPRASRPGDIRPNFQVLAELSSALGHDTGISSQPTAFAALTAAVPFYSAITDAAIGGRGIRWQDTPSAANVPSAGEVGVGDPSKRLPEEEGSAPAAPAAPSPPTRYRARRGHRRPPPSPWAPTATSGPARSPS